jgi:hypothetical protein
LSIFPFKPRQSTFLLSISPVFSLSRTLLSLQRRTSLSESMISSGSLLLPAAEAESPAAARRGGGTRVMRRSSERGGDDSGRTATQTHRLPLALIAAEAAPAPLLPRRWRKGPCKSVVGSASLEAEASIRFERQRKNGKNERIGRRQRLASRNFIERKNVSFFGPSFFYKNF